MTVSTFGILRKKRKKKKPLQLYFILSPHKTNLVKLSLDILYMVTVCLHEKAQVDNLLKPIILIMLTPMKEL